MRTLEKLTFSLILIFGCGMAWAADADLVAESKTLIKTMNANPVDFEHFGQARIREQITDENRLFVTKAFKQPALTDEQWRAVVLVIVMNSAYDQNHELMLENHVRLRKERSKFELELKRLTDERIFTSQTILAVQGSLYVAFKEIDGGNDQP